MDLVADDSRRRFGLARQGRLVQAQVERGKELAVCDHLIARLELRQVPDHDVLDRHAPYVSVTVHPRLRRDQQREPVQGALGAHLLRDPDTGVGYDQPRNSASRQSPNASVSTPNPARIALKTVKTLARTMLA